MKEVLYTQEKLNKLMQEEGVPEHLWQAIWDTAPEELKDGDKVKIIRSLFVERVCKPLIKNSYL